MFITSHDGARRHAKFVSTAETLTAVHQLPTGGPFSIAINPPTAGTVLVEFSASSLSDIETGQGLFVPADGLTTAADGAPGVVTAPVLDTMHSSLSAVRVTATGAGARVEIAQ